MRKWPTKNLADVSLSIDYGHTASASATKVGPKMLRITDIQQGAVSWDSVPFCLCSAQDEAAALLKSGDIVFARTGATTGKSYLVKTCPSRAVFASYLIRVRPSDAIDPRFLAHFFDTPDYWRQITSASRGAAQPGVNASVLKTLRIPVPPIAEQQRIAAILDQADALRTMRRQALAKLDTLTQSLFLEMFGDPATNPERWPLYRLGDLAIKFSDGPFGSNLKSAHYREAGIRVIRLQNIQTGYLDDSDLAYISEGHFEGLKRHTCLPGDVLVATLGDPNLRACIQPETLPRALNKADCVQIRPDPKKANADFLCSLLNLPSTEKMAHSLIFGQTRARIAMGRLRGLEVPLPPLGLQNLFQGLLGAARKSHAAMTESLTGIETVFCSVQHRAFRGEL